MLFSQVSWIVLVASSAAPPVIDGCELFPSDSIWNTPIDGLPVHEMSDEWVESIGLSTNLHPDFGTFWKGQPIGIPFVVVPHDQPLVEISFYYDDSDPGPYPIPPNPPIEGGPRSEGDRHILIVQQAGGGKPCKLWEIFDAWPQEDGTWEAGSGAVWSLDSHALRPDGWTSADAAGLPILPLLVRYDEVQSGAINHCLRFTADFTQASHIWPARHDASDYTDPDIPPMGVRFRLKKEFDISPYPPEVQVILTALKTYGMMLADNGSDWYITGEHDPRWDDDILGEIKDIEGSWFEAVDESSLMVDEDSGQAATSGTKAVEDLDGDGDVDGADLGLQLGSWGACAGCPGDLNDDGIVGGDDLGLLLAAWTG
jgi:hypothetical protein